jgi:hypothetical protein
MENVFLVMELYQGCCYLESKPIHTFTDKEAAELYAKEGNESQEGKDFIERYAWDDVEFKFFIHEIKYN